VIVSLLKEIKSSDVNREIGFLEPRIVLSYCGVVLAPFLPLSVLQFA
jgi:hypothetical protein